MKRSAALTRALILAASRDPCSDPQPGDRLSLGGTVRHVLARDGDLVSWEVERLWSVGSSPVRLWQAQMRSMGGVALEPGTGQRTAPPAQQARPLSPRALRVLGVLQRHTPTPGGPVVARCRAQLHEAATCSRATFDRAMEELEDAKLLLVEAGAESWSPPTLRLTPEGGAHLVAEHPLSTPPEHPHEHPSTETSPSLSKSSKEQKKERREESREGGAHPHEVSTPLSTPHGALVLPTDPLARARFLRAWAAAEEEAARLERASEPDPDEPRSPGVKLRVARDAKDRNGRTAQDVEDEAEAAGRGQCRHGHGRLTARWNPGRDEGPTWFCACRRGCDERFDPGVHARQGAKQADRDQEQRAREARTRPAGGLGGITKAGDIAATLFKGSA